jgi:dCTP deaminase
MILTGPAIKAAVKKGRIVLDPFDATNLNPNSYNYHLGDTLLIPGPRGRRPRNVKLNADGYVLKPGNIYLGTTQETIGSDYFVTLLLGRSSVGRLGIFLNVTADLGHIGSRSRWTLELTVVQSVRIYPQMKIGQVSFWITDHRTTHRYEGRYHNDAKPVVNRDRKLNRIHL